MKKLFTFAAFSMLSFTILSVVSTGSVFAATRTWDGGGGDTNFSTGANWQGDVAPSSGDALVFDTDAADFDDNNGPNNDLSNATFSSITVQGSEAEQPIVTGNTFSLSGNITVSGSGHKDIGIIIDTGITLTADSVFKSDAGFISIIPGTTSSKFDLSGNNLTISGSHYSVSGSAIGASRIKGSGNITINNGVAFSTASNPEFNGVMTVNDGGTLRISTSDALGSTSKKTIIKPGATLEARYTGVTYKISEPIDIGGTGTGSTISTAAISVGFFGNAAGVGSPAKVKFTGSVSLTSNTVFSTNTADAILEFTNLKRNGRSALYRDGSKGRLIVNGENVKANTVVRKVSNSSSALEIVAVNEIVTLSGKRGDTHVYGVLKGDGKVGNLFVYDLARLSSGASPGCLETSNLNLESGSTLDVEIAGTTVCDEYDQTDVTGTVTISDSATLSVAFLDDFLPAKGDEFVIIKNDGSDAVDGTFKDLKEGDTFEVDGVTFKISYKGGDGNDVELSVLSAPDTGLYRDMAPLAPFAATGLTLSLVSAYFIRRKVTAS